MTPSFSLSVFVLTRLLISDVSCVSITHEKSLTKLVRSETAGQKAAEVLSSGHMKSAPELINDGYDQFEDTDAGTCDEDYPMGLEGTCDCSDKDNHALILDKALCVIAANKSGITVTDLLLEKKKFVIPDDFFEKRPMGCFKQACEEDPKKVCYFYNPIGTAPAQCAGVRIADGTTPTVIGTPVCKRARYLNGTMNANGGCPTDYGTVMSPANCSEAALCLGYCHEQGDYFQVTEQNQSQYDDFPLGCFINSREGGDGCVYFNPQLENWEPPKRPIGTPICNVTVQTWWDAGGASADTTASGNSTGSSNATTTVDEGGDGDGDSSDGGDNTTAGFF